MKQLLLNQLVKWEQAEKNLKTENEVYFPSDVACKILQMKIKVLDTLVVLCLIPFAKDGSGVIVFDRRRLMAWVKSKKRQVTKSLIKHIHEGDWPLG